MRTPRSYCFWTVVLVWATGMLLFGYLGYRELDPGMTGADALYAALRLFSLDGPFPGGTSLPHLLQVARFGAPLALALTTLGAVALLLRDEIRRARLAFRRNHAVVCGLGRKGYHLATQLRARGESVAIVERDGDNDFLPMADMLGIPVVIGDTADVDVLRQVRADRAREVYLVTGDESANIDAFLRIAELCRERQPSRRLKAWVHIRRPGMCPYLRDDETLASAREDVDMDVINLHETAVRHLFFEHVLTGLPFRPDDPRRAHLVVVGFGYTGKSMAETLARTGMLLNGTSPKVTVYALDADASVPGFLADFPGFRSFCELTHHRADIASADTQQRILDECTTSSDCTMLAFCLDDEYANLRHAMQVTNLLMRKGRDDIPLFVRLTDSTGWAQMIDERLSKTPWAQQLIGFGAIDETCRIDTFTSADLDRLAHAVHSEYGERHGQSAGAWEDLPWTMKESNRQAALHIPVKLQALGYAASRPDCRGPGNSPGLDAVAAWQPGDDEVETLAELEHRRWVAERALNGWVFAEKKNKDRKESPYLCPWDELTDEVKDDDRAQVRAYGRVLKEAGVLICRFREAHAEGPRPEH